MLCIDLIRRMKICNFDRQFFRTRICSIVFYNRWKTCHSTAKSLIFIIMKKWRSWIAFFLDTLYYVRLDIIGPLYEAEFGHPVMIQSFHCFENLAVLNGIHSLIILVYFRRWGLFFSKFSCLYLFLQSHIMQHVHHVLTMMICLTKPWLVQLSINHPLSFPFLSTLFLAESSHHNRCTQCFPRQCSCPGRE